MNISRKILSVVASVTTAASVLCAVPVSAAEITNSENGFTTESVSDTASVYANNLYTKLHGKTLIVSFTGGSQDNEVTISLSCSEFNAMYDMCTEADVKPSMVVAIMAHESGFNPDAYNSSGASGLMQILDIYYYDNLTRYSSIYDIAVDYAGGSSYVDDDAFNPYGNMAAGISALKYWKGVYGEADMIKAYAQGAKGNKWKDETIVIDNDIRDIMAQVEDLLI